MKKLTELEKAIRAVGSFMGMMAGPGSDMEGQWIIVKNAAQLVEAELPATDNTTKTKICGNTLESDIICMYCKKGSSGKCTECFYNKYEDFKGRKLSVIC